MFLEPDLIYHSDVAIIWMALCTTNQTLTTQASTVVCLRGVCCKLQQNYIRWWLYSYLFMHICIQESLSHIYIYICICICICIYIYIYITWAELCYFMSVSNTLSYLLVVLCCYRGIGSPQYSLSYLKWIALLSWLPNIYIWMALFVRGHRWPPNPPVAPSKIGGPFQYWLTASVGY